MSDFMARIVGLYADWVKIVFKSKNLKKKKMI